MAEPVRIPWAGKRWLIALEYRTDAGSEVRASFVEELDEISELVEAGPHWDTLIGGRFTLARADEDPALTIEQAGRL